MPPITGVIEGFYGRPWSHDERLACLDASAAWGFTHYVWAAKAEPRHRDRWVEPFTAAELAAFAELIGRGPVAVVVALTPGPTASAAEVVAKLRPVVDAGAAAVMLSFDDLPETEAGARHGALATAVAAELECALWVVPTHYAGGERSAYLDQLVATTAPEVLLAWTGPAVVTDSITVADVAARRAACGGRAPLLWDNFPVNDALMTDRLHLGPLVGRDPAVAEHLAGALWNPMIQARASLLPLASCAAWARGDDPVAAWEDTADRLGWRRFAEAVLGALPAERDRWRGWVTEVTSLTVPDLEDECGPWLSACRAEARLALAALDALAAAGDPDPQHRAAAAFALAAWSAVRGAPVSVFGGRLIRRPLADQDDRGRFRLLPGAVHERSTVVDDLVREALVALGAYRSS